MASQWFVRGGGKVYGPLDATRLRSLAAEGKINEATDVATSADGPWHPASKVRGLFPPGSSSSVQNDSAAESSSRPGLVATPPAAVPSSPTPVPISAPPTEHSADRLIDLPSQPFVRITKPALMAIVLGLGLLITSLTAAVFFLLWSGVSSRQGSSGAVAKLSDAAKPKISSRDRKRAKYATKYQEFMDEIRSAAKLLAESPPATTWVSKVESVGDAGTRVPDCPEDFAQLQKHIEVVWDTLRSNGSSLIGTRDSLRRSVGFTRTGQQACEAMVTVASQVLKQLDEIEASSDFERLMQCIADE